MSNYPKIDISYISLILSIISLALYFYSIWNLPKKRAIDQYKISIIREIYPSLMSDLNNSMNEWRERVNQNIFSKLRDIKKSGEINFIKVNHDELYKYLMRIQDEILPTIEKVKKYGQDSEYDKVKNIWRRILLDPCPTHDMELRSSVINSVENVLDNFFNFDFYFRYLVDEDTTYYKELIDSQIQNHLRPIKSYELSPSIVEILFVRASKNREEVQTLLNEIENQFNEIIEDGAIPLLHDKIGKPI